jgi:hypothetical protein
MPSFEALITIERELDKKSKETYSEEEVEHIRESIQLASFPYLETAEHPDYTAKVETVVFVGPLKPLSDISVSLAALRAAIVETMQMGVSEMPLDTLLHLVRGVYETQKD